MLGFAPPAAISAGPRPRRLSAFTVKPPMAAAPAPGAPPMLTIGAPSPYPTSDDMAQALLKDAADAKPRSAIEALGGLAEFWRGNRLQKKFDDGQQALIDSLAGVAPAALPDALIASKNPTLAKLGLEYKLKAPAETWVTGTDTNGNTYQENTVTHERKIIDKSAILSDAELKQKMDLASAGRSSIAVGAQEKQYDKTLGEGLAGIDLDLTKKAARAPGLLTTLDRMEQLAADPNFYSGAGGDLITQGKKLLSVITGDPELAKSSEAFTSLSNQVVLDKIGSLGAGISNADRSFIESVAPRITNTPEGNKLVIDTLRKLTMRDVEVAKFASTYRKEHGGQIDQDFSLALNDWAEKNPLFPAAAAAPAGVPAPTGAAPSALAPGVYEWTPDGIKPAK